jgi:hypothetical protein
LKIVRQANPLDLEQISQKKNSEIKKGRQSPHRLMCLAALSLIKIKWKLTKVNKIKKFLKINEHNKRYFME